MRRKRPNPKGAPPGIDPEYLDMLKDYRKEERKLKAEESPMTPPPKRPRAEQGNEYAFESSPLQTTAPPSTQVYESDEMDDSDDDWENVDIAESDGEEEPQDKVGDLVVTFDKPEPLPKPREKTPRPIRLAIHKFCLLGWLLFAQTHNRWINAREIRPKLQNLLASSIMQELHPQGEHFTPFLKSKKLVDGLRHAMVCWQVKFKVTRPGLCDDKADGGDVDLDKTKYIQSLQKMSGSSDMMCAGFCGLMRAIGLTARLVCSLQPPDINSFGEASSRKTKRATTKSAPIFWTEVYDRWAKGWIVVDPLTSTVKPVSRTKTKLPLEPGVSDRLNILRYCIAWTAQGYARDVTRRYASQYNARTRKKRITYYEGGEEWYSHVMTRFSKFDMTSRDVDEFRELYRYELNEGLPTRVQDFINHPVYVLEEQLHHNQILEPGAHPCGTLSIKKTVMRVFRRNQVLTCHSAQSWYRRGFKLKEGAQAKLRREIRNRMTGEMDDVGLYAPDAVEIYVPEPIGPNGEVPKTEYRTIDLFVPTMLPQGAAHINHPYAQLAAKILQIDYANAVTGVEFGRAGPKSVMKGIVISKQYLPAMELVLHNMETLEREQQAQQEHMRILMLWRKYIVAIQIWERIERMNPDPEVRYRRNNDESGDTQNYDDPERDEVASDFPEPEDDSNSTEVLRPYRSDAERGVFHPSPSSESEADDDVPWEPAPSEEDVEPWEPAPSDGEPETGEASNTPVGELGTSVASHLIEEPEEETVPWQPGSSDGEDGVDQPPDLDDLNETPEPPEHFEPVNEQRHIRLKVPMYESPQKPVKAATPQTVRAKVEAKRDDSDSSDFPELMDELSESEFN